MKPSQITLRARRLLLALLIFSTRERTAAQLPATDGRAGARVIETAVPFLLIAPDARSASMGDAGAAFSNDASAIFWNPARLAFSEKSAGISVSYTPWLQKLVPDIGLASLAGFRRVGDRDVVGASFRYFSLGSVQLLDEAQAEQGSYRPYEFAGDLSFARAFGRHFSLGSAVRFIFSDLSGGALRSGELMHAGTALAMDISAAFRKPAEILGTNAVISTGIHVGNIGNKISYQGKESARLFLPANLRLGGALQLSPGEFSQFTFSADLNKLLVPSPPLYEFNPDDGQLRLVKGKDPAGVSVPRAIFASFTDAPGGLREELQEISSSLGFEYLMRGQFAIRGGYFYESPNKGNRCYFTTGVGLRFKILSFDFAYLLANQGDSPMANTLRLSLGIGLE